MYRPLRAANVAGGRDLYWLGIPGNEVDARKFRRQNGESSPAENCRRRNGETRQKSYDAREATRDARCVISLYNLTSFSDDAVG